MKHTLFKSLILTGMLLGSAAMVQAEPMYITAPDGTTGMTGTFDQMGINWSATSEYFDTNGNAALDFGDTVVDAGAGNINGLLVAGVPQVGGFLDGMNSTWNLSFEYDDLTGVVVANPATGGTVDQDIVAHYTSGSIRIWYNTPALSGTDAASRLVMTLDVFNSNAQIFNALFYTNVNFTGADVIAQDMFFYADGRNMYDLWFDGGAIDPVAVNARIDTNLDGPVVQECLSGGCDWTRTSTLNGSVSFIPEPGVLALLGGGLLMIGFTRRGKKVN